MVYTHVPATGRTLTRDAAQTIRNDQGKSSMSAESTSAEAEEQMIESQEETSAEDVSEDEGGGDDATPVEAAEPQSGPEVEKIRAAMQSGSSVQGKVIGWNDGGMHVAVNDVTAFCPHSEMEIGEPLEPRQYVASPGARYWIP
jgi:ribosomal protein S1